MEVNFSAKFLENLIFMGIKPNLLDNVEKHVDFLCRRALRIPFDFDVRASERALQLELLLRAALTVGTRGARCSDGLRVVHPPNLSGLNEGFWESIEK